MATNILISSTPLNPPTLRFMQQPQRSVSGRVTRSSVRVPRHSCSMISSQSSTQQIQQERSVALNFQPNSWDYESLQQLNNNYCDEHKCKIQILSEEVHALLQNEETDLLSMLELIDKVQRFGLGYRFEENIRKALEIRLMSLQELGKKGHDLHAVALSFRLLRQHGHNVSQDVFKSFMDHEGNFKAGVEEDVEGMLSLYEASHLGLEGEDLMVEAINFTKMNLMKKIGQDNMLKMSKGLEARVRHALETPLHHRIEREEARWSIEQEYKNNDEESTKYTKLLELAKLDFNAVQSTHQTSLKEMSRWWKEMGISKRLSFVRDRLVESFFWAMGTSSETQESKCLKGLTKVISLITIIDDIYDVYGTLDELQIFTNAVKRWDVKIVEELPDYMKLCYFALYNTVNKMVYDSLKLHGVNATPYLSKAWGDLCQSFFQEAKWNHNKETPRLDEYLETAWVSSSGALLLVHAYFLVNEVVINKEALHCLKQYHHILHHPSLLFRLYNDLSTSKEELESCESANSIICYMNETGASEEQGRERVREMIAETWRKMNKTNVNINGSPFSRKFIETAVNIARISHLTYKHGDTHGAPDVVSKNRVKSLIMEPISWPLL